MSEFYNELNNNNTIFLTVRLAVERFRSKSRPARDKTGQRTNTGEYGKRRKNKLETELRRTEKITKN